MTHEALKVSVEKGRQSILAAASKSSSGDVVIHRDELDGPSAFFA